MLPRIFKTVQNARYQSTKTLGWIISEHPELDENYFCNGNNLNEIKNNISHRKGVGDIEQVNKLKQKLDSLNFSSADYKIVKNDLQSELFKLPNKTHPEVLNYGDDPKVLKIVNGKRKFNFDELEFHNITKRLNLVRSEHLGNLSGSKSYYLLGEMVELEQALINYFCEKLYNSGFELISVPDILHRKVIESCGMNTSGTRTQVYSLDKNLHDPDLCLSGTSEMALAGYFANNTLELNMDYGLPKKLMAVSRCYRAETSNTAEEKGIYRVHEFTKVEMFLLCTSEQSHEMLEDIRKMQEENFASLDICFQVLDMPPHELGAPAYRKYDIEAWLPGRKIFGEISSCSNCTDYQSRRLGIKYKSKDGDIKFAHTLNGTACAIPRLLIALSETGQNKNGTISIPKVLQKYMDNKEYICKQKQIPELKLIKHKNHN
ncbi:unnamed protein product [Brassicogethes aeneus]|uniref:Aminoacyl-tRNA synthetase class II (G/ P/ S/T) domain-containing protein n=1 Tax=Brassicogethes aeneus TaxID=1431903 RepID=A0A9P0AYH7_BRAAE|nr:unnamed protein product [Brassicogethes aeneus]